MKKILPILGLLFISVLLIFTKFNQIPKNLALDEVEFTKLALSLKNKPYTPYSNYATGHTTVYFYIILLSFKIFGVNNFALRFPSAIFGIGGIILFYLCSREVFKNEITAIISTFILATSRWYFSFARFGFEATFLFSLELTSLFFLIKFLKIKKARYAYLSMFFSGLSFNSYAVGRIFFLFTLPIIILQAFRTYKNKHQHLKIIFVSILTFLITITPLILTFTTEGTTDKRAQQEIFILNQKIDLNKKINFLSRNVLKNFSMLYYRGDVNGRHNYPYKAALNPIIQVIFTLGLFLSLKKINDRFNLLFLYFGFIAVVPTLLTYPWENPNMLRSYFILPTIVYLSGYAIETINRQKNRYIVPIILVILLSSAYEIRTYFRYQKQIYKQSFSINTSLEHLWNSKEIYLDHKEIMKRY